MFGFIFQLERSILATNPRVTRFKIDWDDDGSPKENVPPSQNPESESNQMMLMDSKENSKLIAAAMNVESNSASGLLDSNNKMEC